MAHSEVNDTKLVLVSARKSRAADHWDKDDYDVRLGDGSGPVVGRIMRHPQAPEAQPWFWTITAREQPPSVCGCRYFRESSSVTHPMALKLECRTRPPGVPPWPCVGI
jgi:hypothetical protein